MHRDAYTCHEYYYEIYAGIESKYIDRHPTASMTISSEQPLGIKLQATDNCIK